MAVEDKPNYLDVEFLKSAEFIHSRRQTVF